MLHFMMSYEPQKNCRQVKNNASFVLLYCTFTFIYDHCNQNTLILSRWYD